MLSVPFVFSMSRFQGSAFRCDKIVVNSITLLEAIEGIPDKDYNYTTFLGTTGSPIFTRNYFMSKNVRVDI